jgi:hypothetical protein
MIKEVNTYAFIKWMALIAVFSTLCLDKSAAQEGSFESLEFMQVRIDLPYNFPAREYSPDMEEGVYSKEALRKITKEFIRGVVIQDGGGQEVVFGNHF